MREPRRFVGALIKRPRRWGTNLARSFTMIEVGSARVSVFANWDAPQRVFRLLELGKAAMLVFDLGAFFAFERQHIVFDVDFNVLLIETRKLSGDLHLSLGFR